MIYIYVGKKLYYLNRYYKVIFARIEKIEDDIITVKDEYGHKFNITLDQIDLFSRILPKKTEPEKYLQCLCGCMRFYYQNKKLYCRDCNIEYNKNELDFLNKCDYIEEKEDIPDKKIN